MYERFTDRARKTMQLANEEALRFDHGYVGTEHILLGLVKEGSGVAANALRNLGADLRRVRSEVERILLPGPGGQVVMGRLPHAPRAKKVIEYSIEEARNLNHDYVGTEHLLLALIREQEGVAAQVLMNLGLTLERVREEVLTLLGNPPADPAVTASRLDAPGARPTGPPAQPIVVPPPADGPAAVLAAHVEWLRGLMERCVAERRFELAAEVREQVERVRAVQRLV
jgi:ATP-dependent Clp protease ATP-binding subunit ClpA